MKLLGDGARKEVHATEIPHFFGTCRLGGLFAHEQSAGGLNLFFNFSTHLLNITCLVDTFRKGLAL